MLIGEMNYSIVEIFAPNYVISETAFLKHSVFDKDMLSNSAKEEQYEMKEEFEKFYRRYYAALSKFVFRQIGEKDATEDIVQEVFCLAYEKWVQVSVHTTPEGWLMLVARYKMREFWRLAENRKTLPLEDVECEPSVNDENYGIVEIEAVAKSNLQREEWNLMKSYYWENRNVQILAEQAGVESSCMRMRISRITKKLRTALKGKGQGAHK